MKVLMYGWEFPPRISGGLGVACHAIVTELAKKAVDITLVLPYTAKDIVPPDNVKIFGCDDNNPDEETNYQNLSSIVDVKFSPILAYLTPYVSEKDLQQIIGPGSLKDLLEILAQMPLPDEIKQLAISASYSDPNSISITGKYGFNLLIEVFRYALLAGTIAKKVPHDIIHAHDWLTVLAAIEAKKISKKPLVFHIHALETDRSGLWVDKRIFAIEKYGMEQADRVITVSQYTKNIAVQYYGISPEKISVVHNGNYSDPNVQKLKERERFPAMVLFLGRVTHQKGPYFFIEVAKKVLSRRSDVQFVIAGTGDLLTEMIEKTAGLRIGKNVHFLGFLDREKVKRIFMLADVYVMPSVSEPFGLSSLEAISQKIPAVISKQSGVSEVLHHTLASDYWDTEDMAAKVLALLQYKALRETSIANSMQDLKTLTWEHAANEIINVYKQTQGI